ncbi:MAG: hypothetical protein Fur0010_27760 [Bdellovibrio sp.]
MFSPEGEELSGFENLLFQMGGTEGMPLETVESGLFGGQTITQELAPLLKSISNAEGKGEALSSEQIANLLVQNLNASGEEKAAVKEQLLELGFKFDGEKLVGENGKTIDPMKFLQSVKANVEDVLNDSEAEMPLMKNDFSSLMQKRMGSLDGQKPIVGGQDFIENMRIMNNRQAVVMTDSGPQITNLGQKAYAKEASLFEDKILNNKKSIEEVGSIKNNQQTLMDVMFGQNQGEGQQAQMNLNIDQGLDPQALAQAEKNGKVLDLSHISAKNSAELIGKITNYIEQNAVANSKEVDVFVKHDELGVFRINAKRGDMANTVDLSIVADSVEGHEFFVKHESELLKGLNNSGIKVTDLKIATMSENHSMSFDSQKGQSSNGEWSQQQRSQQFSHGQSQQNQDSERRRGLWQRYQESMYQAA